MSFAVLRRPCRRMPSWKRAGLALALLLAVAPPAGARAAGGTFYVDSESRGGACSDARAPAQNSVRAPWCTLDEGLRRAPSGSTVLVRAGGHPRLELEEVEKSSYVTVAPYAGEVATVHGATLTRVAGLRFRDLTTTSGVMVTASRDVEFVGGESALRPARRRRTASAFVFAQVADVLVADRYIHDGFNAVLVDSTTPRSRGVVIRGNRMERMGGDGVHVGGDAADVRIEDNEMVNIRPRADMNRSAHSDAVQVIGPSEDVVVSGNVVTGGRGFLFMVSPEDQDRPCCGHVGTQIVNNVLAGNSFGLRVWSLLRGRIANNTVWGTTDGSATGVAVFARDGRANPRTAGLVLANNIMRRLTVGAGVDFAFRDHNLIRRGPLGGPNDQAGSPVFADLAAGDLRLTRESAGVDAAAPAQAPPTDASGLRRFGPPDIGALEFRP